MSTVSVKSAKFTDGRPAVTVVSPYHPDFAPRAKRLGGIWQATQRNWAFDARDEERVRDLLREVYGTDGSPAAGNDLVTVRLTAVKQVSGDYCGGIYYAGRCLATAFGRDTGAKLGEGVVALTKAPKSGGSARHWLTIVPEGCVLELRDVPRPAVEAAAAEDIYRNGEGEEVPKNFRAEIVAPPAPEPQPEQDPDGILLVVLKAADDAAQSAAKSPGNLEDPREITRAVTWAVIEAMRSLSEKERLAILGEGK